MINVCRTAAASVLAPGLASIAACAPGAPLPQALSASAPVDPGSAASPDHHQGAVSVAQPEIQGGGNAQATELARSIVDSQQQQIQQMQSMLNRL